MATAKQKALALMKWLAESERASVAQSAPPTEMFTIKDGERLIKKLEACESMAAKLVLLRMFGDKYARSLPAQSAVPEATPPVGICPIGSHTNYGIPHERGGLHGDKCSNWRALAVERPAPEEK